MPALRKYFALLLLMPFVASSCNMGNDSATVNVSPRGWYGSDARTAIYHNEDTVSLRDVNVFIVHNKAFVHRCDSLRLAITTIAPDSTAVTELITVYPPESHSAGLTETAYRYRTDVRLEQTGAYSFTFVHPDITLVMGLRAVGVSISRAE